MLMISYYAGLYTEDQKYYVWILAKDLYDLKHHANHGCLFEISESDYNEAHHFDDKYRKWVSLKVYARDIIRSDDHVLWIKISKEMFDGSFEELLLERLK